MRATSRAGSALAATTLAAFFAPGDAAEVTVKISYPDRDAGSTAARVLVATLVTLAVSVLVWMVLRRSASSTTRTSTSTTTAEQDVVNDNEEIDGNNGWEVLTGDDDEEDTTAGAPAVGGHGRSAEGQAGSSAASRERPAVARRAGEAARASGSKADRLCVRQLDACRTECRWHRVWRLFGATTCRRGCKELGLPTTHGGTPKKTASDTNRYSCVRSRGRLARVVRR